MSIQETQLVKKRMDDDIARTILRLGNTRPPMSPRCGAVGSCQSFGATAHGLGAPSTLPCPRQPPPSSPLLPPWSWSPALPPPPPLSLAPPPLRRCLSCLHRQSCMAPPSPFLSPPEMEKKSGGHREGASHADDGSRNRVCEEGYYKRHLAASQTVD
jgi:hypothetical protein